MTMHSLTIQFKNGSVERILFKTVEDAKAARDAVRKATNVKSAEVWLCTVAE